MARKPARSKKQPVNFRQEPLRYLCNEAFYLARGFLPAAWNDGAIAFVEGAVGGYLLVDLGAAAFGGSAVFHPLREATSGRINQLESITNALISAEMGLGGGSYLVAPQYANKWMEEHPTYSWGVIGLFIGSLARAFQQKLF